MFQLLNIEDVSNDVLIPLDAFTASEAFITLVAFMQGDDTTRTFRVHGGALAALRGAAAKIVGAPKDKQVTSMQYAIADAAKGAAKWGRVKKGEQAPQGAKTREVVTKMYTSEALRKACATLRDAHGINIANNASRLTSDDKTKGYRIITLQKIEADESKPANTL